MFKLNTVVAGKFMRSEVIFVPKIKLLFIKSLEINSKNIQSHKILRDRRTSNDTVMVELLWNDGETSVVYIEKKYCQYLHYKD